MSKVLGKGAYELVDFDGNKLPEPRNGLYLKKVLCLSLALFLVFLLYVTLCIICWLLKMYFEWFVGFAYGASHHTCNLASTAWVIY